MFLTRIPDRISELYGRIARTHTHLSSDIRNSFSNRDPPWFVFRFGRNSRVAFMWCRLFARLIFSIQISRTHTQRARNKRERKWNRWRLWFRIIFYLFDLSSVSCRRCCAVCRSASHMCARRWICIRPIPCLYRSMNGIRCTFVQSTVDVLSGCSALKNKDENRCIHLRESV